MCITAIASMCFASCGNQTSGTQSGEQGQTTHTHDYHQTVVPPTCTEKGYTDNKCDCGESFKSDYVDAVGHDFSGEKCLHCDKQTSKGLTFTLINGDTEYELSGIGTFSDTELIIPDTYNGKPVTSINEEAFNDYYMLVSVTIPKSITNIGEGAFSESPRLLEVINLSELSITEGSYGLNYVKSIKTKCLSEVVKDGDYLFYTVDGENYLTAYLGTEKNLVMPDSYNGQSYIIGSGALYVNSLESVTVGKNVTKIDFGAFAESESLKQVIISDSVTYIGYGAFMSCFSLESVTVGNGLKEIEDGAFMGCGKLKEIVLPDSLTDIGEGAFCYCEKLLSVVFGKNVKTIGNESFSECCSLTSIEIPNGVIEISKGAFSGCSALASVKIGKGVKIIGKDVFSECENLSEIEYDGTQEEWESIEKGEDWNYKTSDDCIISCTDGEIEVNPKKPSEGLAYKLINNGTEYEVTGIGRCTDQEIVIPATHNGLPVTSIAKDAFDMNDITSLSIGNKVKEIGRHAFQCCRNLKEVKIGNGVKNIDFGAFSGCLCLESVIIGNNVESIGEGAFSGCDILDNVNIPKNVKSIGKKAFSECYGLKNLTIENGVEIIGDSAFSWCNNLKEVIIPKTVISIGEDAFFMCSNLESISIENGVKEIKKAAFYECEALNSIEIPDSVESIGEAAFYRCWMPGGIKLGSGVKEIKRSTFGSCRFNSIILPDNITSIGEYAFYFSEITEITLSKNITTISEGAFSCCFYLEKINFTGTVEEWESIEKGENWNDGVPKTCRISCTDGEIEVNPKKPSEGLAYDLINNGTEYEVTGIGRCADQEIVIPETYNGLPVTSIAEEAFANNYSIKGLTIGKNVITIGDKAFYWCGSIKNLTIKNGVVSIGRSAFAHCYSLTSLVIPDSVTSIGQSAFRDCYDLADITIGKGVTSISDYAFYLCASLKSIVFPSNVTSIGECAFQSCGFTSLEISNNVKFIGYCAFNDCENLKIITFNGTAEEWQSIEKGGSWNSGVAYDFVVVCSDRN